MDSNHDKELQRLLCYHYTTGHGGLKLAAARAKRKGKNARGKGRAGRIGESLGECRACSRPWGWDIPRLIRPRLQPGTGHSKVNPEGCQRVAGGRRVAESSGNGSAHLRTLEGCQTTRCGRALSPLRGDLDVSLRARRSPTATSGHSLASRWLAGTTGGHGNVRTPAPACSRLTDQGGLGHSSVRQRSVPLPTTREWARRRCAANRTLYAHQPGC